MHIDLNSLFSGFAGVVVGAVITYILQHRLERFKHEIALLEKRRELSAQVVDLINRYKELPPDAKEANDEQRLRSFEQDYYKLIPWIPTDTLKAINLLFSESRPGVTKPDVKDVIIAVRKAILNDEAGDFKGADIVHFVGFGKRPKGPNQSLEPTAGRRDAHI